MRTRGVACTRGPRALRQTVHVLQKKEILALPQLCVALLEFHIPELKYDHGVLDVCLRALRLAFTVLSSIPSAVHYICSPPSIT
jgi:hypothetical protein